jgi:hypothetical protein
MPTLSEIGIFTSGVGVGVGISGSSVLELPDEPQLLKKANIRLKVTKENDNFFILIDISKINIQCKSSSCPNTNQVHNGSNCDYFNHL